MKAVGLITEYNPFHNGHKFHLEKALALANCNTSVVIMNGNFMQRGIPAAIDKYTRTKMALAEGVDFVFELPVIFGISSAEDFAKGSIRMLQELGFVDSICFGSESGDLETLQQFAHLFAHEPALFRKKLNALLKEGHSFPAAREKAALQVLNFTGDSPLSGANNLLGIEYLKALIRLSCTIKPFTIRRTGTGYHDPDINGHFASASAIRTMTERKKRLATMPEQAGRIYEAYLSKKRLVDIQDFSEMIYCALRQNADRLSGFKDISPDLANRIRNELSHYTDAVSFLERLSTKQHTRTRLNRCLLQALLGIEKLSGGSFQAEFPIPLRLLGMRREKSFLLNSIPDRQLLITNPSKAKETLPDEAYAMLEKDFLASDFYSLASSFRQAPRIEPEYKHSPIIV